MNRHLERSKRHSRHRTGTQAILRDHLLVSRKFFPSRSKHTHSLLVQITACVPGRAVSKVLHNLKPRLETVGIKLQRLQLIPQPAEVLDQEFRRTDTQLTHQRPRHRAVR